ncbi:MULTISPECIES: DUF6695 family protein [unclassified Sphingobacterium]|uniref:DUF6695 family protein n=1 Tax=unclassified Sphingobacterium TaxID=2609468 RepID=UPI00265D5A0C|nr:MULTISPECIES: DUF6695 family protein [unclassified Sphingobacterium]WKK58812.1 hypothetical protein QYC40_00950 [Sphingobacterium sp. BN32]
MSYKDFAIILTWPDATIRGDEKWMMFFKKIGLVKNLNFKVGHTGVVIVDHHSGEMLFYDFGRYITPRGYGRARSKYSDPKLHIRLQAIIENNKIKNIDQIVEYFEDMKPAMYGEGRLFFNIVSDINFQEAKAYGDYCVEQGTYPYGAVARNNNNCSRFITRMLMKASDKYHYWHGINLPETIKASPISNVVNANKDRIVYSYSPTDGMQSFRMNRWQSFGFLLKQLGDNVFRNRANQLPTDLIIGAMAFGSKPITVPKHAKYLGGVGDGAWYYLNQRNEFTVEVSRYTTQGELEYVVLGESTEPLRLTEEWEIAYDSHLLFTHIKQNGRKIRIKHLEQLPLEEFKYKNLQERYA